MSSTYQSEAGVATPAVETSEDKKDGLSSNQKLALGAGAGLAAGGLGGAALASRSDDVAKVSLVDHKVLDTLEIDSIVSGTCVSIRLALPHRLDRHPARSTNRPQSADPLVSSSSHRRYLQ